MTAFAFFLILFIARGFGQNCIKYGEPTTLTGTLLLRDEAGYNQYIALRLERVICTVADPTDPFYDPTDPFYRMYSGIREVQANAYGSDPASSALRDRLNRLIGHRVF